uniref:Uncharacterized protein n=1 Tax=Stomoxys calcitrans TaxID=35570 RepID=A0A1I8P9L5_STOCA
MAKLSVKVFLLVLVLTIIGYHCLVSDAALIFRIPNCAIKRYDGKCLPTIVKKASARKAIPYPFRLKKVATMPSPRATPSLPPTPTPTPTPKATPSPMVKELKQKYDGFWEAFKGKLKASGVWFDNLG